MGPSQPFRLPRRADRGEGRTVERSGQQLPHASSNLHHPPNRSAQGSLRRGEFQVPAARSPYDGTEGVAEHGRDDLNAAASAGALIISNCRTWYLCLERTPVAGSARPAAIPGSRCQPWSRPGSRGCKQRSAASRMRSFSRTGKLLRAGRRWPAEMTAAGPWGRPARTRAPSARICGERSGVSHQDCRVGTFAEGERMHHSSWRERWSGRDVLDFPTVIKAHPVPPSTHTTIQLTTCEIMPGAKTAPGQRGLTSG